MNSYDYLAHYISCMYENYVLDQWDNLYEEHCWEVYVREERDKEIRELCRHEGVGL